MKRVAICLVGFFPYCVLLVGVLLGADVIRKPLTDVSFLIIIGAFVALYGLAQLTLRYILREADNKELIRLTLGLKWAHIPAHLFNIVISVLFALTIFGVIFVPFIIGVTALGLDLTGQIGREAIRRSVEEGLLTQDEADYASKKQKRLFADVKSIDALYRKTKEVIS